MHPEPFVNGFVEFKFNKRAGMVLQTLLIVVRKI